MAGMMIGVCVCVFEGSIPMDMAKVVFGVGKYVELKRSRRRKHDSKTA